MFWLSMVLIGPKQHHVIFVIVSFLAELFRRTSLVLPELPFLPRFPLPRQNKLAGRTDRKDR